MPSGGHDLSKPMYRIARDGDEGASGEYACTKAETGDAIKM
jgi:hypothetical protein